MMDRETFLAFIFLCILPPMVWGAGACLGTFYYCGVTP